MKRIGIIGGLSFESTTHYYERINREINKRLGGTSHASADMVLRSVNFEEYYNLMRDGHWDTIAKMLSDEALTLRLKNKCDYVAIASNTMHKVADQVGGPHQVEEWPNSYITINIPLIHIGDCIVNKCLDEKMQLVTLIGTRTTLTESFMKDRLRRGGRLEVVDMFDGAEVDQIDRIIFDELCHGKVTVESRDKIISIINRANERCTNRYGEGFGGVILGCTELEMLFDDLIESGIELDNGHRIKFINSTQVHIDKIVKLCLS
ncbi:amino acid racemase [Candidatus Saccharibacteria bacterium]|nr:amino acid racemase [Candidatus Saccharibacteria bacterium]